MEIAFNVHEQGMLTHLICWVLFASYRERTVSTRFRTPLLPYQQCIPIRMMKIELLKSSSVLMTEIFCLLLHREGTSPHGSTNNVFLSE